MSSISSVSGNSSMMMQNMRGMKRPDPAEMAANLFSKLDTTGQGYIQKSDLQTAFNTIASDSSSATDTSSVDELFSQLDSDSDGKVTEQEFSDTLKQVAEQLDSQFMSMRLQEGGMPPPPPPGGKDDAGFSKDELTSQLESIGSSDSQRAELISNVVNNFDKADADGDGKVSFKEAMTFDQESSASATSSGNTSVAASTSEEDQSTKLMAQIMKLMHAYGSGEEQGSSSLLSMLSTTA